MLTPGRPFPSRHTRSSIDHTKEVQTIHLAADPMASFSRPACFNPILKSVSRQPGPKVRPTSAVKHNTHSIMDRRRSSRLPSPALRQEPTTTPIDPDPELANAASDKRPKPLATCPIRNRIESLFTMSKSQTDALDRAASGHRRHKGQRRQTFCEPHHLAAAAPGLDPEGEAIHVMQTRKPEWWSLTGSNRRHPACKAGALPAELRPHSPRLRRGDWFLLASGAGIGLRRPGSRHKPRHPFGLGSAAASVG